MPSAPTSAAMTVAPTFPPGALLKRDISLEITPELIDSFTPTVAALPAGTKVFLPHLQGKKPQAQIDAARRLRAMGYTPVPHLGARNFDSVEDFVRLVRTHSDNGVTHALFLGGNPLKHRSPFDSALDLLRHEVIGDTGLRHAFISGYPEGHPDIDRPTLDRVLDEKVAICAERGLSPEVVTQFAFDGTKMADWANALSTRHPHLPLRLGLAGVTSLPKLIKFAAMCGVGPSLAALRKNAGGLMSALTEKTPGDVIAQIEADYRGHDRLNLHFFPFGGWKKTLDWVADQGGG